MITGQVGIAGCLQTTTCPGFFREGVATELSISHLTIDFNTFSLNSHNFYIQPCTSSPRVLNAVSRHPPQVHSVVFAWWFQIGQGKNKPQGQRFRRLRIKKGPQQGSCGLIGRPALRPITRIVPGRSAQRERCRGFSVGGNYDTIRGLPAQAVHTGISLDNELRYGVMHLLLSRWSRGRHDLHQTEDHRLDNGQHQQPIGSHTRGKKNQTPDHIWDSLCHRSR
jgi:hypothetical protein